MAKVCPLFSSSSGNSIYIGDSRGGVLIDAGVNAKQLTMQMEYAGITPEMIHAVFVTHEHTDHIGALRVFCSKHNIDVYSTQGTYEAFKEKKIFNGKFTPHVITGDVEVGNLLVRSFATSHDSRESCGYTVFTNDERKISVLTDTGVVTPQARESVMKSDLIVLESNHDVGMLRNGPYDYMLKKRILSDVGHLSNDACDEFAVELLKTGTTRFVLAHLSRENNIPDLAYQSAFAAMCEQGAQIGRDYTLSVAKPKGDGEVILL